ncbi:SDR family oxidoreductase [Aeromicrobium sp.]|uniref:SDR family NAD(P)-dependent oxidoreductase n=1 Tax=Aeromicrobium sp. TaxID=1871063 RepID=UPI0019CA6F6A|nr:SDR family oxidoreductase [Aeromicrobium sp.]MBC7633788.1 SDR family oxidoreductase [Aeromicrobium sp.]
MDLELTGRKALVTAGTRGIGRAVVERLVSEGMQVALCARNPDGVAAAVAELGAEGQVIGASVDVSDHAALTAWVEEYADRLGGVDVIVSNASALGGIPHSPEGWRRNFEVDVMSAVSFVDAALPFLRRSEAGSIVQIGTITAVENHFYPGGGLSYGPMKAALINYVSQLAKELGPDGIRANAVSPGPIYIEGGSWDRIRQNKPDYYEANKARHPSGRFGRADEVADVVAFFASPRASWVNGQNLVVDGSFTMRIGY